MSLGGPHAFRFLPVLALSTGIAGFAHAQDDAAPVGADLDSGVNLESLLNLRVVTASGGVEEEASLAPASVVVFTRDDIARQGWTSLAEVLQNTPGLDVVDDQVMPSV